jgi:hypothetical protein
MGARPGTTSGDLGVLGEYRRWIDKSAICGILYTGRLYLDPKRQTPGNREAQSYASLAVYKERQTAEELGYA